MRTIRITLFGGPHDGQETHADRIARRVIIEDPETGRETIYLRSERRDAENRQVFMVLHSRALRTLQGLTPCDLG